LRFPSLLLIPIAILFDGTVSSSTSLALHPIDASDSGIAALGFLFTLAVMSVLAVATIRQLPLKLVRTRRRDAFPVLRHHERLRWLFFPRSRWAARNHLNPAQAPTQNLAHVMSPSLDLEADLRSVDEDILSLDDGDDPFRTLESPPLQPLEKRSVEQHLYEVEIKKLRRSIHFVIDDLSIPQYTLLELVVSFVIGVCSGIRISDRRVCLALSVVSGLALLFQLVVLLYLRPIVTRFNLGFTVVVCMLCLSSCCLVLISMSSESDAVGNNPAVLSFLGMIITTIKSVVDLFFLGCWAWYALRPEPRQDEKDEVDSNATYVSGRNSSDEDESIDQDVGIVGLEILDEGERSTNSIDEPSTPPMLLQSSPSWKGESVEDVILGAFGDAEEEETDGNAANEALQHIAALKDVDSMMQAAAISASSSRRLSIKPSSHPPRRREVTLVDNEDDNVGPVLTENDILEIERQLALLDSVRSGLSNGLGHSNPPTVSGRQSRTRAVTFASRPVDLQLASIVTAEETNASNSNSVWDW
jgi:hypothetical protein